MEWQGLGQLAAAFERFNQGHFVGIFQIHADRDSVGDPGGLHSGIQIASEPLGAAPNNVDGALTAKIRWP